MIPEYKRDKKTPLNMEEVLEGMPDVVNLIAMQSQWDEYEQAPDFSDIPQEFQGMIPDNVRKQKEDLRTYNIWLTKQ